MSTEYIGWVEYFKQSDFVNKLNCLKQKCQNKKVVIYCNGIFFDALSDTYNLSDYFNIYGISDIRYENSDIDFYKGFSCIKPSELNQKDFDIILIATPNFQSIKKFFGAQNIKQKSLPLFFEKRENFFFRKSAANYRKVLSNLKHKSKIKVLFTCEENSKWSCGRLYNLLKNNPRFEVLPVVLFPIITKNRIEFTQQENIEFFSKFGIKTIDGYDYEEKKNRNLRDFAPDIVFYQQPWYLQGYNHPQAVSEYALTVMFPYGYTTLSPDEWGSYLVKKVYSNLWKFFSESPYHNKFYARAANMKFKNILYTSGSLKLDEYRESEVDESVWKGKGKRIIWAPHHSINNDGLRMGTFKENYRFFLEYARNHTEYSFLLKPHPALKTVSVNSGIDYEGYIDEWCKLPNACVYDKGDYFDIFKTSDVLITDCSSFLAEYFLSEKPIIFIERPDRAPFDEFGNHIKSGFYTSNTNLQIEFLLEKLLTKEDDTLKSLRKKIIKKYFYFPEHSSAEIVFKFLCKSF